MSLAPLDKIELFSRLAQGHAARITVVTPNTRLAQELAREFDQGQAANGLKAREKTETAGRLRVRRPAAADERDVRDARA